MIGPNPGAGIKLLIHNQSEIPLVRDLGQAIPPGSYAFVGLQMIEVSNFTVPKLDIITSSYQCLLLVTSFMTNSKYDRVIEYMFGCS